MSRSLVRNVFSNWAGLVLNMATAFFMSPFLVRNLGDTWYGLWVLIRSTTGYMSLLDGGLRVSIVKYVAKLDAVDDAEELNKIVTTAVSIYGGLSIVVIFGTLGIAAAFPHMFHVAPEVLPTAQAVVLIAGASVAVSLLNAVFGGFIAGMQRYDIANQTGIVVLVLRTIAIVWLIWKDYGIIALGLVHLATQVGTGVWQAWLCFRLRPDLRIARVFISLASTKTLYGYSVFVLMNNMANILLFRTGEMLAGMFLGPVAVTYYAIAGTLTEYLQKIIVTMTMVLHPYSSAKDAKGDAAGLRTGVLIGAKVCMLIALPVTAVLVIVGDPFIAAWMGASYAVQAAPVLVVLSIGRMFWFAQAGSGEILLGIGRHKQLAVINLITGVLSFLGGMALIRPYGLYGMAVGASIPLVIVQGLVIPFYIAGALKIPGGEYVKEAVVRPVLATLPYAILVALGAHYYPLHRLPAIFLLVIAASPAYLIGAWFLGFDRVERATYLPLFLPGRLQPRSSEGAGT
jgi:O-antigen/teichoic acid export membrane protein